MSVPKFYEFMLPLLKQLEDGKKHLIPEIKENVITDLNLSLEDLREFTRGGNKTKVEDRFSWAKTYLKKACLIEQPERFLIVITERGKKVLEDDPPCIDTRYLKQFPEFCEFQNLNKFKDSKNTRKGLIETSDKRQSNDTPLEEIDLTPLDELEIAYTQLQTKLKQDLLENIMKCSSTFFERLVVKLLINLGYGFSKEESGEVLSPTRDGGVDGVIKQDKLGLEQIYIQAKKWDSNNTVGSPEIQKFAGALQGKKVRKGVFITTSRFSKEAEEFVKNLDTKIILVNGDTLTDYMIQSNTGVLTDTQYKIKKIDFSYFEDEL